MLGARISKMEGTAFTDCLTFRNDVQKGKRKSDFDLCSDGFLLFAIVIAICILERSVRGEDGSREQLLVVDDDSLSSGSK